MEAPIRPRTLYISTKLHGVTFKKNAEILVYSLNLDAKSERQIKYDPYRGFRICVLRVPSLTGITVVRKPKCDWHFTCKLWFQIYTSHTSWFHSGTSLTHWFQTKTSLSPVFRTKFHVSFGFRVKSYWLVVTNYLISLFESWVLVLGIFGTLLL